MLVEEIWEYGNIVRVSNFPQHMLCYLFYGDREGISDEDVRELDRFMEANGLTSYKGCSKVDGTQNEFCSHPAFGLACATVDMDFLVE